MNQKDLKRQDELKKQADRADNIADQTVDDAMKKTLRDAAEEYRDEAEEQERKTKTSNSKTSNSRTSERGS